MKTQKPEVPKTSMAWRWSRAAVACAAVALLLSACGDADNEPNGKANNDNNDVVSSEFALQPAQSCDEVKDRLVAASVEEVLKYRYEDQLRWAEDGAGGSPPPDAAPDDGGDTNDGPSDYTDTNVQEEGVDEPDIVKTDGKFIYTVHGNDLVILKSWPADETQEVGRYSFGSQTYPSSLFLRDDYVAVFSSIYDNHSGQDYFYGTRITILDVSDRTAPTLARQLDVEGYQVSARMVGGTVYLVTNSYLRSGLDIWQWVYSDDPSLPPIEYDADEARRAQLRDQARPVLTSLIEAQFSSVNVTDIFPRSRIANSSGQVVATQPLYGCTDLYLPPQVTQLGMLNISHFDLDDKSNIQTTGLVANGWLVYASQQNLYIAMSSRWWWWGWGSHQNESHIHKFKLSNEYDEPAYLASGRVDGWILNQFSMSEHNGYLRVATTDNRWDWDPNGGEPVDDGGNHLIVLEQSGDLLQEKGSVRNLAPGERIYSARMMGDKGYMVTFRETDPLYTFDLSDPANPQMLGELKIEGFSSYIHPMGPNHLLTIGRDGDAQGNITGVHLQIFDVTDMANPTRAFHHVISTGSWSSHSEALWNHHAFTYHAGKELLAVPVSIYDTNDRFSGLMVFKASNTTGFAEVGRVDHADLVAQNWCQQHRGSWDCTPPDDGWNWWTGMRRSIFMFGDEAGEDYVYSLSGVGLKVNDLNDLGIEYASVILGSN